MFTQSHTAIHISVEGNLDDDFNGIGWIIEANGPEAFDGLAVSQSPLELLEEQK